MPFSSSSSSSYLSLLSCSFLVVDVAVEERFPFNLFLFLLDTEESRLQASIPSKSCRETFFHPFHGTGSNQPTKERRGKTKRVQTDRYTNLQLFPPSLLLSLLFFHTKTPKKKMSDDENHSGGEDNEDQEGGAGAASSSSRPQLQLDKKTEQGFVSAFRGLPPKPSENTMRLFERDQGGFYTAHDDDAHYVATTVFKTTTVIKQLGGLAHHPPCPPVPCPPPPLCPAPPSMCSSSLPPLASLWHFLFFLDSFGWTLRVLCVESCLDHVVLFDTPAVLQFSCCTPQYS